MSDPWYRAGRGWYVTMADGKQVPLGVADKNDLAGAIDARNGLVASRGAIRHGFIVDLIPRFLDHLEAKGLHPRTIRANRYELNWLIGIGWLAVKSAPSEVENAKPVNLADLNADRIGVEAIKAGWSDSHRHNVLATIQRFARWGGLKDFEIPRPAKESRGAQAVITDEEWQTIQRETSGDFHQLLQVLWYTGARPAEIAGLTVESIDWNNRSVTLKHHKTKKKGKSRIIHFGKAAMEFLTTQKNKYRTGPLFRDKKDDPFGLMSIVKRLYRINKRCGTKVTSYCFRHTYATRLLSSGQSDTRVAAMLGHSGTNMIHKNYSHISDNAKLLKEIAEQFG